MDKKNKEYKNENIEQINLLGRKYQSVFVTSFLSERGDKPNNNGYVSYIELDNFGCWLVVDGDNKGIFKDKIASYIGEAIIEKFITSPTINKKEIEKILMSVHKKFRNMQIEEMGIEENYSSCSIAMFVTDYSVATFASIGNTRYSILRNHKIVKKNNDDTLAYLQYEAGNILYDEIRFRKDKNIFIKRFGIDKKIKINISDVFILKPNDKVLLYTQGAWENLDEEDIELISETSERPGKFIGNIVNKMKRNCFLSLGNYTLCGIYVNRPLDIPIPLKNNTFQNKKSLKRTISIMLILSILIGTGFLISQKIKYNNYIKSIENDIAFNFKQGKKEIKEKNYLKAITNYENIKELYSKLSIYKQIPENKIREIDTILKEIEISNKVYNLYNQGEKNLELSNFVEAIKSYEEAILILTDNSLDVDIKSILNQQLEISKKLLEVKNIKIKADELYNTNENSKQKKAIELYKNIAPIYKNYNKDTLYSEIMEKINKYKEYEEKTKLPPTPPKSKKVEKFKKIEKKSPIYEGDIKFNEFKYFSSLKDYENALKKADTPEKIRYFKGKIDMNEQLLIAVKLELKGDEYLAKEKNYKKVREYYEKALEENKKLANDNYMPKDRYNAIINRLENKLKNLK